MITPAREDITIYQGATFYRKYTWKTGNPGIPVDITGYVIRMQVRPHKESSQVLLDLDSASKGGITITSAEDGQFAVRAEASATDDVRFSKAVYDIELEAPDGTVNRLVEGSVNLSRQVTRT